MTVMDESGGSLVRAQAEAAAWIALLHSDERNEEVEAGLIRWIAADPLHTKAWEAATDIWNETGGLPRRIPQARALCRGTGRAYLRPVLAIAAVCLIVAGTALQHYLLAGVSTAVGEQRTLSLEDGSRVELNTDSRLVVKYDHNTRTVLLKSGEAYFQVAHESRPFVVIAGQRKILALGTTFTVRRDDEATDDSLTVTLLEGRVAVAPVDITSLSATPAADVKVLHPGEQLRIHQHAPPTLKSMSTEKATGWMRGQLIFDHTPLQDALAEFNRYSSLKIKVATPEVATIPVGGIFRIGDSKSFATAVAETYGLRLVRNNEGFILESTADKSLQPDATP